VLTRSINERRHPDCIFDKEEEVLPTIPVMILEEEAPERTAKTRLFKHLAKGSLLNRFIRLNTPARDNVILLIVPPSVNEQNRAIAQDHCSRTRLHVIIQAPVRMAVKPRMLSMKNGLYMGVG
jgi:hypothetical protein